MKKLEALKIGGVQRKKNKKKGFVSRKAFYFSC
jgi:hypothetical protein